MASGQVDLDRGVHSGKQAAAPETLDRRGRVMDVSQDSPWSGQPASVRRQHISQYVAFTPGLTGAMSLIADLWDSWRESPEGEISFIQGETRAGKTTALDECKRVFYRTGYARGWPRRRVTPGPSSVIGTAWLT
ncbi:hypothetical protein [Bradyrhizobium diazoefficiens]|uniref:hypothetical protein n=1 Tax=Bradyrhizobium diazoefficiens TaxID=1355477 RepID=UPI00272B0A82|nr:hypothetical protein [Bradyrhizobium diazoefficiens]WLA69176.1 hypothetical protein QNN01_22550 [Bradyrhizobium diazoefficiens]